MNIISLIPNVILLNVSFNCFKICISKYHEKELLWFCFSRTNLINFSVIHQDFCLVVLYLFYFHTNWRSIFCSWFCCNIFTAFFIHLLEFSLFWLSIVFFNKILCFLWQKLKSFYIRNLFDIIFKFLQSFWIYLMFSTTCIFTPMCKTSGYLMLSKTSLLWKLHLKFIIFSCSNLYLRCDTY